MKPVESPPMLTVHDLRDHWLPHKERLNQSRDSHPTSVRFHRACSWLEETERFDANSHADHRLIFQWTAFNALYGQWDLLLPTFLRVWIEQGADEDWGVMCYPPVDHETDHASNRRPR